MPVELPPDVAERLRVETIEARLRPALDIALVGIERWRHPVSWLGAYSIAAAHQQALAQPLPPASKPRPRRKGRKKKR